MKSYFPNISLPQALLSFLFYLSLARGTSIGIFYPADEFDIGHIDYTPLMIINIILLLGLAAYFFIIKDFSFLFRAGSQAFIAVIGLGIVLSLALSVDIGQSVKYVVAMVVVILPSVLYFHECGADGLIKGLSRFVVVMAFVNMAYLMAFPQYAIMTDLHEGRWKGMFEHKNEAGPFFAISLYFILYTISVRKFFDFGVQFSALVICLLFTIFSESSTALVVFVVMGASYTVCYFLLNFKTFNERAGISLASISFLLLIFVFFGGYIESLFFELTGKDATLTGRTGIWSVILDLVAQRPFIGFGPGMSERPEFMEQIQGAVGWDAKGTHNGYLDLLINYGYPTAIIMSLFVFQSWIKFLLVECRNRIDRKMASIAAATVLTALVDGFSSSAVLFSRDIFWIYIVCGLLIVGHLYRKTRVNR